MKMLFNVFRPAVNGAGAPLKEKEPFKLRRRHIKKAAVIGMYTLVAVAMVIGMVGPLMQR